MKVYPRYVDTYGFVKDCICLKTDEDDLKTALRILDEIRANESSVKTALDILEDAKTILMEMTVV